MNIRTIFAFSIFSIGMLSACGSGETVNFPPVTWDVPVVANGNTALDIDLEGWDRNGDKLLFSVTSPPQHGSLAPITSVGTYAARVAYTPEQDYHGSDEFGFRVLDSAGRAATGKASIVVNNGDPGYTQRINLANACHVPNGPLTGKPWPSLLVAPYDQAIAETALQKYRDDNRDYTVGLQNYEPLGDYLNYGLTNYSSKSDRIIFDDSGIPLVKYGTEFHYNPVTVANYALSEYGKYVAGIKTADGLLAAADKLLDLQDDRGALLYPFSWRHYLLPEPYEQGWTSGMAQGMALSVFYRAYAVTSDPIYLKAGNAALEYLNTPVVEGGVMDTLASLGVGLESFVIFEEYLGDPAMYTLNGFMFTMLGLYDWSKTTGTTADLAENLFGKSLHTLAAILPYYEIGGFSAYDLGHVTYEVTDPHIGVAYHAIHISLLHALESVTGNTCLARVEETWVNHVSNAP